MLPCKSLKSSLRYKNINESFWLKIKADWKGSIHQIFETFLPKKACTKFYHSLTFLDRVYKLLFRIIQNFFFRLHSRIFLGHLLQISKHFWVVQKQFLRDQKDHPSICYRLSKVYYRNSLNKIYEKYL